MCIAHMTLKKRADCRSSKQRADNPPERPSAPLQPAHGPSESNCQPISTRLELTIGQPAVPTTDVIDAGCQRGGACAAIPIPRMLTAVDHGANRNNCQPLALSRAHEPETSLSVWFINNVELTLTFPFRNSACDRSAIIIERRPAQIGKVGGMNCLDVNASQVIIDFGHLTQLANKPPERCEEPILRILFIGKTFGH